MLPIYDVSKTGKLILKPFVQLIYEKLYDYKIRDFCFIVGRSKRAVQDHFTPDFDLLKELENTGKKDIARLLKEFFSTLENSNIMFVHQPKPIGFGDAIHKGKRFADDDIFLLHAGDDIVLSKNNSHLKRLENYFKKYEAEIACLVEKVDDPKQYGVVEGHALEDGVIDIERVVEKPNRPKSSIAIIAIYMFKPTIFDYLELAKNTINPEKQLARAFDIALKKKARIIGVELKRNEKRIDIGTPESYSKTLLYYRNTLKNG